MSDRMAGRCRRQAMRPWIRRLHRLKFLRLMWMDEGCICRGKSMAIRGRSRGSAELRKKPCRHFEYAAWLLADAKGPPRRCAIADISAGGARLLLDGEDEVADRFVLLLDSRGGARRHCRVVWRDGSMVGVEFARGPS